MCSKKSRTLKCVNLLNLRRKGVSLMLPLWHLRVRIFVWIWVRGYLEAMLEGLTQPQQQRSQGLLWSINDLECDARSCHYQCWRPWPSFSKASRCNNTELKPNRQCIFVVRLCLLLSRALDTRMIADEQSSKCDNNVLQDKLGSITSLWSELT